MVALDDRSHRRLLLSAARGTALLRQVLQDCVQVLVRQILLQVLLYNVTNDLVCNLVLLAFLC